MALHFCKWDDRVSLLVDAENEDDAREIAAEVADGEKPSNVVVIAPRVFVAEVVIDEDEDEEGDPVVMVDPLEHAADLLSTLEDGAAHGAITVDGCGESADLESGEVVFCELDRGHEGKHEARAASGELAEW